MKKLETKDILLIQKKIDGDLSSKEEEKFNNIIETSNEAKKYYKQLLSIHLSLNEDSDKIKKINITDNVFSKIENKRVKNKNQGLIFYISNHRRQILSYAAILIIGIFTGFIADQIAGGNDIPESKEVTGTIIKNSDNIFKFKEEGIEILAQRFDSEKIKMYTISVNTMDSIFIQIENNSKILSKENVEIIFSNGEFSSIESSKEKLSYLCKGEVILQIIGSEDLLNSKILFLKEGRRIYKIEE
ncbi:MAG: hypothetical protein KA807_06625 [Prolixibacteraceae bacterium]|nr:hypothetical protein [Prolixibacteraceae bacterium]